MQRAHPSNRLRRQDEPALVGRSRELDRLRAALGRVGADEPGAVLLTGEPGVGKSRLAREGLALAQSMGFATFAGKAHELGHDIAYAPLAEALEQPLRRLDRPRLLSLAGDLPQLGLVFSGIGLNPPPPLGDPMLERTRVMAGFSRLIDRLARQRPLALLIDDLHAADGATVALVRYLAASVSDRPILLLLVSILADESSRDRITGLAGALHDSAWWVEELEVPPLSAADARDLVSGVLGHPAREDLASVILERCGGRPLFLEGVARTVAERAQRVEPGSTLDLAPGDMPLPKAVRAQLRLRFASVDKDERSLLNLLSTAEGALEHEVLLRAGGLPEGRTLDALERLQNRALLAPPAANAYDLAHGLLREALRAELAPLAAQRLHAAIAAALTALREDDPRIPEHVLSAGPLIDPDRALHHLVRGAEHARRLGAAAEGARYLAAAASLAREQRADELGDLLARLGETQAWLGNRDQAQAAWSEAAAVYARRGDAMGSARIHRQAAMLAWSGGDFGHAREHLAAAEQTLAGLEPSLEHAAILHARAVMGSRLGDAASVAATAARLRELAERLGAPSMRARADLVEAALDAAATDFVSMMAKTGQALAAAEEAGEPELVIRAHDQLSVGAATQGDMAALRRHTVASLEVARRLGAPMLEGFPRSRLAVADLLTGDWDAALRRSTELLTLAQRIGESRELVSSLGTHAWILVHRGRLAEAHGYLERAQALARPSMEADRHVFTMVVVAGAALALAENEPARAREVARQLEDLAGGWFSLLASAILGEARARSGDLDGAQRLVAAFRRVKSCSTRLPGLLAGWLEGLIRVAEGRDEDGAQALCSASAGFATLSLPFHAARSRLAASHAVAVRDLERAVTLAREALEVFDRIGAPVEARAARVLLRSWGVRPGRTRTHRSTGGPLSARELEVARLVASGLSSADVATRLFISPRTVTTHLERIYARLDLSSRVALTRYMVDSGLLGEAGEPARQGF